MRISGFACAALLIAIGGSANAEVSGNRMREVCHGTRPEDRTSCRDYVGGVVEGIITAMSFGDNSKLCVPTAVTYEQAVLIADKLLRDNPEALHLPARILIYKAMLDAYPCTIDNSTRQVIEPK